MSTADEASDSECWYRARGERYAGVDTSDGSDRIRSPQSNQCHARFARSINKRFGWMHLRVAEAQITCSVLLFPHMKNFPTAIAIERVRGGRCKVVRNPLKPTALPPTTLSQSRTYKHVHSPIDRCTNACVYVPITCTLNMVLKQPNSGLEWRASATKRWKLSTSTPSPSPWDSFTENSTTIHTSGR